MLTSVVIDPTAGSAVTVNDLTYPLQVFTWEPAIEGPDQAKSEAAGSWNTWKRVRAMTINMEGDIVASTTSAYWTARKALMAALMPVEPQADRVHAQLRMVIDGDAATYYADCVLEDLDAPLRALYPTVTEFQAQWTNNFGYWRRLSDNAVVLL